MKQEQIKAIMEGSRRRGIPLLIGKKESLEDRLRAIAASSGHQKLLAEVREEADRMLGEADPELSYSLFRIFNDTGERLSYERVYFERRKRLNAFVMLAMLEKDNDVYIEAMCNTLWSICGEYTWSLPAHYSFDSEQPTIDLFAAETAFTFSEILQLMEDKLPPIVRKRMADEVEQRVFKPFLHNGPYGWEASDNNWAAVCAGSIGAAALYLIDDSERLAAVLARVLKAMDCYLSGFGDDGACAEGYLYWQYGFGYYVYFAKLLQEATNGAIDLFRLSKVKAIALFQQKCFTSGRLVVNFSDSLPESGIFMGLSSCLHNEYDEVALPDASLRAAYTADHCGRWAPAIRELLWWRSDEQISHREQAGQLWPSESYYMSDVHWLIARHHTDNGHTYSFAAKGGHNDEPHNHNDIGHFIIHADGEAYLADLGSGMYTSRYFGPDRYTIWCNGSQGHSVPITGGSCQQSGRDSQAVVKTAEPGEDADRLVLDMSAAYPEEAGLLHLERSFLWSKADSPSLVLVDAVQLDKQPSLSGGVSEWTERFITLIKPEVIKPGRIILQGKQHKLSIAYDADAWEPVVTARSDRNHFGQERHWYTLDMRLSPFNMDKQTIEAKFVFQFED